MKTEFFFPTKPRGVYRANLTRVKPILWPSAGLSVSTRRYFSVAPYVLLFVSSVLTGCMPSARVTDTRGIGPIGVRYSVQTAISCSETGMKSVIERDFAAIKKMGMDTICLRHCHPQETNSVLESIAACGLKAIVDDPAAIRYVKSGSSSGSLLSSNEEYWTSPVITFRYIGHIVDEITLKRAATCAKAARNKNLKTCVSIDLSFWKTGDLQRQSIDVFDSVVWENLAEEGSHSFDSAVISPGSPSRLNVQAVRCRQYRKSELETVRQWLGEYHLGLTRGCCDGVVFDTYRTLPGDWSGIVIGNSQPSPERGTMIRKISDRCRNWNEYLAGLKVQPVETIENKPEEIKTALFSKGSRKYLLIVNRSYSRFFRSRLSFPTVLGDAHIDRAVTVSTAEDSMIGSVYRVHNQQLRIDLDLSPGEARLFELF